LSSWLKLWHCVMGARRDLTHSRQSNARPYAGGSKARLALERLEDRVAPVVGAFDVPSIILPPSSFDGVVRLNASVGGGTGSLLSTGRNILTAAHSIPQTSPVEFPRKSGQPDKVV
jgi:hypothetical protein